MILIKDRDWETLDGKCCEVTRFIPFVETKNPEIRARRKGKPYAAIYINSLEGTNIPDNTIGMIFHKNDFLRLCAAFSRNL